MGPEGTSSYDKNSFIDRQKQLNEQLCIIEKSLNKHNNHKGSHVPKLEDLSVISHNRNKIRGFRGRQSMFKRPEGPAPRSNIRTIPDYRRNPTKWTCYSLDDVSDMSNESNSQAAFSFLKELKQRKVSESQKQQKIKDKLKFSKDAMEIDESVSEANDIDSEKKLNLNIKNKTAISFRKPQTKDEPFTEDLKPEFRGNKIIMPEYQVGVKQVLKKKKISKNITEKIDKNKELKLDHLQMYDDGEE